MNVLIDKSFEKDVQLIHDSRLRIKLADVIDEIIVVKRIIDLKSIKKLKGDNISYRIRIGDYRIGLEYDDNCVKLIRFLHRKKIYKSSP